MTREKADGRIITLERIKGGEYIVRWGLTDVGHYATLKEAVAVMEKILDGATD